MPSLYTMSGTHFWYFKKKANFGALILPSSKCCVLLNIYPRNMVLIFLGSRDDVLSDDISFVRIG